MNHESEMENWHFSYGIIRICIESIFPNFFPEYLFADTYIFVPRFLFLFLILLAIFYDWKKAVFLAIGLGLLMDIVFIEILGISAGRAMFRRR